MSLYGHHEPFDFSVVVPGGGHVYFTTFAAAEKKEMGCSEAQELQTHGSARRWLFLLTTV